jgi:hypothetical protein
MKIFMEPEKAKTKERKVMFSTSLPKDLRDSLQETVDAMHRKKADWVRAALAHFLDLGEKEQEGLILNAYKKMESVHLRPFTTTLLEGQLMGMAKVSKKLRRSKADVVRAAIFTLLSRNAADQEKEIKKSLSR